MIIIILWKQIFFANIDSLEIILYICLNDGDTFLEVKFIFNYIFIGILHNVWFSRTNYFKICFQTSPNKQFNFHWSGGSDSNNDKCLICFCTFYIHIYECNL